MSNAEDKTENPQEFYDELARKLDIQEINYILMLKQNERLAALKAHVEKMVPDTDDLIAEYSKNQYIQQRLQVNGLDVTFRTLNQDAEERSLRKAENDRGTAVFSMILSRYRLAHAIVEIDGVSVEGMMPSNSYMSMPPKQYREAMEDRVEKVYDRLSMIGQTPQYSELLGIWLNVVNERTLGQESLGDVLKKSTRTLEDVLKLF